MPLYTCFSSSYLINIPLEKGFEFEYSTLLEDLLVLLNERFKLGEKLFDRIKV